MSSCASETARPTSVSGNCTVERPIKDVTISKIIR